MGQDVTEKYAEQLNALMKEHERRLDQAQQQFEATVATAQNQLNSILGAVTQVAEKPPEPAKPEAVFTTAEDGERLMVMNEAAVDFMTKLFDLMQGVVQDLSKLLNKG